MTNDMRKEVIEKMFEVADREIIQSEIMSEFYQAEAEVEKEAQKKSNLLMKKSQVDGTIAFNKRFRDFVSTKK